MKAVKYRQMDNKKEDDQFLAATSEAKVKVPKSLKIKCYCCQTVYDKWELFRYECMCFNEGDIPYRGICLNCEKTPESKWKEIPNSNHHFQKIHTHTKEYDNWFNSTIGKYCGNDNYQMSFSGGKTIFQDRKSGNKIEVDDFVGKK